MPRGGPRPILIALVLAAGLAAAAPATAAPRLPRFASLSSAKVYLRQGPSFKSRILWVYHRKGLPVEIIAQFDVWRRVRMPGGTIGWIHVSMLTSSRTVVVTSKANAPIREDAAPGSRILALAAPGVVAKLDHCGASACEVHVSGTDGWIEKKNLWGVRLGERQR